MSAASRTPMLRGHPDDEPTAQPKHAGWHWKEWVSEYLGTAFQLFVGFTVVGVLEAAGAPGRQLIGWGGGRLLLIGVAFGVLAALVAVTPFGRRSGAHLNPAVTLGFWARGHTHGADLAGFAAAQVAGATSAAWGYSLAWPAWSYSTHIDRTAPAAGFPPWAAAGVETALTCGLLLVIFTMVSSRRFARWTPAAVTGALSGLIWAGAPVTGASMNPARTIGPDLMASHYPALWAYLVGPATGALLAAGVVALWPRGRRTLTAKLFHDSAYPSVHRTDLPAKPYRGSGHDDGRHGPDAADPPTAAPATVTASAPTPHRSV